MVVSSAMNIKTWDESPLASSTNCSVVAAWYSGSSARTPAQTSCQAVSSEKSVRTRSVSWTCGKGFIADCLSWMEQPDYDFLHAFLVDPLPLVDRQRMIGRFQLDRGPFSDGALMQVRLEEQRVRV